MTATGAAMRLSRTPMLISERNWPGGSSTAQKNKPTLKPRAAQKPITTSSRQPIRSGRWRPTASAIPVAMIMPIGLPAITAIGSPHVPCSSARSGIPALTSPKKNSAICAGYRHQTSN